ncbi:MAG TPA: hypothetical protein PK766_07205 [Bacteroidales bacterium]|nr:hypothetical protein [Bacteroidales bacterium]
MQKSVIPDVVADNDADMMMNKNERSLFAIPLLRFSLRNISNISVIIKFTPFISKNTPL